MKSLIKCNRTCDKTKSCFVPLFCFRVFFSRPTVWIQSRLTHQTFTKGKKNFWKLVKKNLLYFLGGRGCGRLQSYSFNHGLSPALGFALSSDKEFVVISGRLLAAGTHFVFSRVHTQISCCQTHAGRRSGNLFNHLTVLVGDLESVWPHKDAALSLGSTTITVFLEQWRFSQGQLHRYGQEYEPTPTEINRYRGWISSRNGW